jgi:Family of unknown function (DUF7009)
MKIRIQRNTIRLRLSQKEVDEIGAGQKVVESTSFPSSDFEYTLGLHDESPNILCDFNNGKMLISINRNLAISWANNDEVGLNNSQEDSPYILIEKDFQCLTPRANEDESDLFTNPNLAC